MVRFSTCVLLALSALLICAPSSVTQTDAVSLFSIASAADSETADVKGDDDDVDVMDDDEADDDDFDDSGDDDDDEDGLDDEDEDSEEPAAQEPDKPALIEPEGDEKATYTAPKAEGAIFFEDFQSGLSKWTSSEEPDYSGEFKTGQGAKPTLRGDRSLIIPEKARKYGLSTAIKGLSDLADKDFVVQYELKMEEGVSCGGAYLKMPLVGFVPKSLKGETPYSVMFGPDKCGTTDKVHFIFQSKNPVTNKLVEHHLKTPPTIANSYDKKTHLYTLIVRKDKTFEVHVDMEKKSYGSLSEKFTPAVQPEKEIDDPEDKKPEEWVDEKKIPDPEATKPDDWDEDAPKQIPDMDAVKPEGWLDDEPETIPDPQASKPEEWDDEEDGQWEAPMAPNPNCEPVGCGKWERPLKDNPDYKGKWNAPMIDNPKYIGEWSPRKIPNPDYYEVTDLSLMGIGGVAFEIWTMDQGVLFDNLFIGNDIEAAESYANATFRVKQTTELDREEKERAEEDKAAKKTKSGKTDRTTKVGKTLGPVMDKVEELIEKLEVVLDPVEAWLHKQGMEPYLDKLIDLGIQKPMILVVSVPVFVTLLLFVILGAGKKSSGGDDESVATETTGADDVAAKKKTDDATEDAIEKEGDEAEAEHIGAKDGESGIESTGLRQRATAADS